MEEGLLRTGDKIALCVYFAITIGIGLWSSRKSKNTEGYFVGGRSIPGWAIGLSMIGTGISSISFLAYPGSAYLGDWSRLVKGLMIPFAALVGVYVFVPFYRASRFTSAYEYLENRFSPGVRIYGCLLFTVLSTWRMGSILYLLAMALVPLTGWNIEALIVVVGILVTGYTVAGGIEAVIWTDVMQTIVLLFGGILVIGVVFANIDGGAWTVFSQGWEQKKFHLSVDFAPNFARDTFWVLMLNGLIGNIQEFACDQTKVQRYCAAKSDKDARWAVLFSGFACIPIWTLFMFIGSCLFIYYANHPDPVVADLKADEVFPHFIVLNLPVGIAGFLIAALLAAAMSSIDSSMNGTATILTVDIYKRLFKRGQTDKHYLLVARILTALGGTAMIFIALGIILLRAESILDWAFVIGAIVTGGLGGVYFLGFFSTRANSQGVTIGVICALTSICYLTLCEVDRQLVLRGNDFQFLPDELRCSLHPFLIGAVANFVSFGIGYLVSYRFPAPSKEKLYRATWWTRDKGRTH